MTAVWTHWLLTQVSVVQMSLSAQSLSLWQQSATAVCWQWPAWQVSVVQTSLSLQLTPQAPQLLTSVWKLGWVPPGHSHVQVVVLRTWPLVQLATQLPLQAVVPAGQAHL